MQEEKKPLLDNKTWDVVNTPEDAPLVGSKWVYIIKYWLDGSTER